MQLEVELVTFLSLVWATSAIDKFIRSQAAVPFMTTVSHGLMLSRWWVIAVGALELFSAVMLSLLPSLGAALSVILLGLYTALVVSAIRTGSKVSCGCGGVLGSHAVSTFQVVRNCTLLVAVVAIALLPERGILSASIAQFTAPIAAGTALAIGGLTASEVYTSLGQERQAG
ncbi:MAG: hypothetical protein M0Z66_02845 [Thermaerobacter sp.]|nr:hypothetical protein [Thermaerobacter sp.]